MTQNTINLMLILLGFLSKRVVGDHCSDADIELCWEPMDNLPEHLTWTSVVPTLSEEDMRTHCSLFDSVEVCLKGLEDHCHILDVKAHQGVIDAYKWICDESFEEYLLYRECFSNTDLHTEGRHCNDTLITKLDNIDETQSTDYQLQRICQYANDYLDCVENAVTSFCGLEAALWQRQLDTRNIQPIMELADCQLDENGKVYYQFGESKIQKYIIITCVVVIGFIIILLGISMLFVYKNRKARAQQARQSRQVNHVNYTVDSCMAVMASSQQAGPLPQKLPQPPPYMGSNSNNSPPEYIIPASIDNNVPPQYTIPNNTAGRDNNANDYVDMRGLSTEAAGPPSFISNPPPYIAMESSTISPSIGNMEDQPKVSMDNPVYHDFSKNEG